MGNIKCKLNRNVKNKKDLYDMNINEKIDIEEIENLGFGAEHI